jgi:hypothetical protein
VYAAGLDVLVNLSFVDELRHDPDDAQARRDRRGARWGEAARLTLLVRDAGGWDGDVERFEPWEVAAPPGRIEARLGDNALRWEGGRYELRARLRERPIEVALSLEPACEPALAPNIPLETGPPIHWAVVPRLWATGWVKVGGRRYELSGAPSYHDHNWGRWSWGDDFAWEWGFGLAEDRACPWHVVFVRLSNRARTRALAQGLFLWRDGVQRRVFREHDVEVWGEGLLRPARTLKLPRVMGLLSPGSATDVPQALRARAHAHYDNVEMCFLAEEGAQVILPNDKTSGVTIINEVSGALCLEGEVGGEAVELRGRAVFEFLGA